MTEESDAGVSIANRVAVTISVALSPLLMPTLVSVLILTDIGSDALEITSTMSVVFVAFFVLPLMNILWMIRRGKTPTLDVPNSEARTEPFVAAVLAGSVAVLVLRVMGLHGEPIIHAILVAYIINSILIIGINVVWKISVHMVALSGSIAMLVVVSGLSGANSTVLTTSTVMPLFLLIPAVGWARYQVKAHTVAQIVVGTIVGFCGHWLALLAQVGT
jgi:membrane-associated phospholipid phosphatase